MANDMSRRSFDLAASGESQAEFNARAAELEAQIARRDADVAAAMADYYAEGVSDDYSIKEQKWKDEALKVRTDIATLRDALRSNDETATVSMRKAQGHVDAITV